MYLPLGAAMINDFSSIHIEKGQFQPIRRKDNFNPQWEKISSTHKERIPSTHNGKGQLQPTRRRDNFN